jgi:hypothetical protein
MKFFFAILMTTGSVGVNVEVRVGVRVQDPAKPFQRYRLGVYLRNGSDDLMSCSTPA